MIPDQDDPVSHPKHYNDHPSGIECIAITRHMNFNVGNAIKYLWRHGKKDPQATIEDLKKAAFYIKDEIERLESQSMKPRSKLATGKKYLYGCDECGDLYPSFAQKNDGTELVCALCWRKKGLPDVLSCGCKILALTEHIFEKIHCDGSNEGPGGGPGSDLGGGSSQTT